MKNKSVKIGIGSLVLVLFLIFNIVFFIYAFFQRENYSVRYDEAMTCLKEERYEDAIIIFRELMGYKDVDQKTIDAKLTLAEKYIKEKKLQDAVDVLDEIDKNDKIAEKLIIAKYDLAVELYNDGDYDSAKKIFYDIQDYKDSKIFLAQIDVMTIGSSSEIVFENAKEKYSNGEFEQSKELLNSLKKAGYLNHVGEMLLLECNNQIKRRSFQKVVTAGIHSLIAINSNGNVDYTGDELRPIEDINKLSGIISIDTYGDLAIGLLSDGTVQVAGKYNNGTKSIDSESWNGIIDVAAGEQFVLALKQDGLVYGDGHNGDKQIDISEWKDIIAIDAGWSFSVGLTKDHQLVFAGNYNDQQMLFDRNKEAWKDVVNISAGGGGKNYRGKGHTVGLKADGTVVAIGDNDYGQCDVDNWKDIVKVSAGDWYTVGLKSDGTILITGENAENYYYIEKETVSSLSNVVDIAAGYGHTLCLLSDGRVVYFGFNDEKKKVTDTWKGIMIPESFIE